MWEATSDAISLTPVSPLVASVRPLMIHMSAHAHSVFSCYGLTGTARVLLRSLVKDIKVGANFA